MKSAIVIAVMCGAVCAIAAACWAVPPAGPAGGPEPWWSNRAAGLIGGIVGSLIGVLGGVIGVLAGMGKARGFVLGLTWVMIVFGVICLIVGVVAVIEGQPYAVYYPALLVGFILTLVMGINIRTVRTRYQELELRRMRAQDAREA